MKNKSNNLPQGTSSFLTWGGVSGSGKMENNVEFTFWTPTLCQAKDILHKILYKPHNKPLTGFIMSIWKMTKKTRFRGVN